LENGEFLLHYQPQIELATGRTIGAEALIRWNHPEMGLISPARFIPIAESSGMIVAIGGWVLREACRQAASWRDAGFPELVVAVNLSAMQFKRGDLQHTINRGTQGDRPGSFPS
jgi:EAL domain-containing protein (putative c-di-GMP-specific phosphodiesterase class I)